MSRIKKIGNELTEKLNKYNVNGKLMTTVNYGDLGWKSGYFSDIGNEVRIYTPQDSRLEYEIPKSFDSFVFYISLNPKDERLFI